MKKSEFSDRGLLDRLENLKIEKYKHGSRFGCVAPTWLISEKTTIEDYLDDIDNPKRQLKALRDFACMPNTAMHPFFKDPAIIINNANPNRIHPLTEFYTLKEDFYPLSGVKYYMAFDLSVSKDGLGGAMVHREFSPGHDIYVLDWSIWINPSFAEVIDYEVIRNLVRLHKKRGFNIGKVGFDQFQSHDSAIILANEGYDVEIVKYMDSFAGCGFLWDLIHSHQIDYFPYERLCGEMGELQVVNSKRIDHLTSGGIFNGKDAWDALVNACVLASQDKPKFQREFASN